MAEKLTKKQKFKRFLKRNMTPTWAKRFSYQVVAFLISVAMIVGVAAYAFTKSYDERKLTFVDGFTVCVHTGAYGTVENGIEFIEECIKKDVKSLQINIRRRPDGTVIMSNDIIATNRDGIELATVLSMLSKTNITVNMVINDMKALNSLHDLLVDYSMTNRVFLTGIEVFQADAVKENCPDVDFYVNYLPSRYKIFSEGYQEKIVNVCEKTGAVGINCNYAHASGTLASVLHKNGYKLSVWTVDKTITIKRILASKPDVVTTKEPDRFQEIIDNWKRGKSYKISNKK